MRRWMRHAADFPAFEAISAEDTVVDIGCGSGGVCVAAGLAGAEVIGIDIDPGLIPHLEDRMREVPARSFRALASDCDPIPLPDGVASFVVCTEVMEHVDHPARFAFELNRIARPGATLIISVPDPASESLMHDVVAPSYFERPNHQRVYSHGDLDVLLQAAGLDVVDRPRAPNNFYWAVWCLLRWSSSADGDPEAGFIPPVIHRWNEVWNGLLESPGGDRIVARLDRMIPRSQVVVARKSSRAIDLRKIEAAWSDPARSGPTRARATDPELPRPGHPRKWRRFLKDGRLGIGRVELSWSIRRSRPSTDSTLSKS